MSAPAQSSLLVLNVGSSSLKFAVFELGGAAPLLRGNIERVGQTESVVRVPGRADEPVAAADHVAALHWLVAWIARQLPHAKITAIGHRIVHGGPRHRAHCRLDAATIEDLAAIVDFAPEHVPAELDIVRACRSHFEGMPQYGCFDTAFHRGMPLMARQFAIPRRFGEAGIERYGFHGLSCSSVMQTLRMVAPNLAQGRVVVAHIGSGVSLTAVRDGQSIDTTMGFTPAAGVPMGSRSGDIDPGIVRYLLQREGYDAGAFDQMINHQSGLLGISETSGDVRDLLRAAPHDHRATEALNLFCYRIRQAVGSLSASLGGIDALVFTGGVGEHAWQIRQRVCAELGFLGIELDDQRNRSSCSVISSLAARTDVHVIPTDEEAVIAAAVVALLKQETIAS